MKRGFLISITLLFCASSVFANPSAYFTKNSVRDIFSDRSKQTETEDFVLLPVKKVDEFDLADELEKTESTENSENKDLEKLPLNERLKEKYGDPSEAFPVTPVETAPAPFKAMVEALGGGDKELAFKYAVQYVKYRKTLKELNEGAVNLIGLGKVKTGILPKDSWATTEDVSEDMHLLEMDLGENKEEASELPKSRKLDINKEAQKLIERSKKAQNSLFDADKTPKIDSESLGLSEETERKRAFTSLKNKLPKSKDKKVDIYFFFGQGDKVAAGLAPDIQKLYEANKDNPNVNFVAFTMERLSKTKVSKFRRITKTTFPIISGRELASKLQIRTSPSVLFILPENNRSHLEEGPNSFYYLDEITQIMTGQK